MKEKPSDKSAVAPKPLLPKRDKELSRDEARKILRDAGLLVTDFEIPPDLEPVSDDELEQLGVMRPGARPSEDLIAEDRGR
jgi:hypothetical protein